MFFTIPVHDFLLAAMVLCLDLSVRLRANARLSQRGEKQRDPSVAGSSLGWRDRVVQR